MTTPQPRPLSAYTPGSRWRDPLASETMMILRADDFGDEPIAAICLDTWLCDTYPARDAATWTPLSPAPDALREAAERLDAAWDVIRHAAKMSSEAECFLQAALEGDASEWDGEDAEIIMRAAWHKPLAQPDAVEPPAPSDDLRTQAELAAFGGLLATGDYSIEGAAAEAVKAGAAFLAAKEPTQ